MTAMGAVLALLLVGAGCTSVTPVADTGGGILAAVTGGGTVVDLHGKGLTAVPQDVLRRGDVTRLDISGNAIDTIPAEIRHMRSLEELDASDNALTGLPAELGQLDRLRVLDVSGNDITGLPYELGNLSQLEVLDLSGNPYSQLDLDHIREGLRTTDIRTGGTTRRCSDLERPVSGCTKEYRPVCGAVRVECITTPCNPVPETFPNACVACQNERVETYTDGACAE